jgi:MOSC domain-containing protein YiiM
VREVAIPDGSNRLNQSVAACLASILELDVASVPLPPAQHPEPWTVWRNWLGQRGLGLVPVADPVNFSWPGPWIAVLPAPDSGEERAAVAFGAPPGVAWSPLPTEAFDQVREGFVIAPADIVLMGQQAEASAERGTVAAILIAAEAEAEPHAISEAQADAGRGLVGDRYHAGVGTFSNPSSRGHDLTLVEQETIDDLRGVFPAYGAEDTRRNVVTSGIALNGLVGWRFRVGEVECIGQRLCEPCAHLDRIAVRGALRHLVHRGGLRADIVTAGRIALGDPVERIASVEDA